MANVTNVADGDHPVASVFNANWNFGYKHILINYLNLYALDVDAATNCVHPPGFVRELCVEDRFTASNFTHDAANDEYDSGAAATCTLTSPALLNSTYYGGYQNPGTITSAVAYFDYSLGGTAVTGRIANAGFESSSNWTYTESDASGHFVNGGFVTDFPGGEPEGSQSYKISHTASSTIDTGQYGQISQTGVDLSNIEEIAVTTNLSANSGNIVMNLVVDSVGLTIRDLSGSNPTGTTIVRGTVPLKLRTTNKTVTLQIIYTGSGNTSSDFTFWFDKLVTYRENNTTTVSLELSANGGTNYETVTNGALHTFTNTGTDLRARITFAKSDTATSDSFKGVGILVNP